MSRAIPPELVVRLLELARTESGFVAGPRVQRCVEELGGRLAQRYGQGLDARLDSKDPEVLDQLHQAISVGETFVFRQPEHFTFLRTEVARRFGARKAVNAWSAGCSTGEEAFTLAAVLREAAPHAQISVLGTDLDRSRLARAQHGVIRRHAVRESSAPDVSLLGRTRDDGWEVIPEVRALVRFERHNLLEAAPGRFDVILCRNVLIYFTPEANDAACERLAAALVPGGLLMLGAVEACSTPRGLRRIGPPELQVFEPLSTPSPQPGGGGPKAGRGVTAPAAVPAAPVKKPAPPPPEIALHLSAIARRDESDLRGSADLLDELCARYPNYLPGLLDRGLLHARLGEPRRADRVMQRLAELAQRWPPGVPVEGPEALGADYYLESASAFLAQKRGGR